MASSSSSPTPLSTSSLIALASPSFIALFLLPHTTALVLKLSLSFPNTPRSIFHRPYYDKVTFVLPALSSFLYGVGGVFSLLSITRYTQDGGGSPPGRGFMVVHGVTQTIGRFGGVVCLLVLLATFGPRSDRRPSRAHLAPFTAMIVVFLFALALASMALSTYLSIPSNFSTTNVLRILSIIQPSLYVATLFFTLATFTLLSMLFRFADAISRLDGHPSRGSVAEDFLASKASQYGVRPSSTSTIPPRRLRELNYSTTISKLVPRILTLTLAGLVAAGLQLADRLLDRDMLDATHIGMSIVRGVCEVLWIGGVTHLFYGLCKPRPKVQRTPTEDDDHPASNTHLPPSSSGNHLLHTRSNHPASSSSPGSESTTLPHTPATPTFPTAPKATLRDEIHPSSGVQQHHRRGRATTAAGYASTYLETGSNHQLVGAGVGGPGIQRSATLSEEFLALRTNDPFASPPPGTAILPRVPSSPSVRKKRSVAVVPNGTADSTAPATATSKSRRRPNTGSSDEVLSDGWKGSEEGLLPASNAGGGPSSKKARTVGAGVDVYGAHGSSHAKLSKRSSQKPTFSRRPSNKRRRSGGFNKSKKGAPAETTNGVASPFDDAPSLVPGTTRPRPPRSPVSHLARHVEETNSLGLVVYDHQSMPGASTPGQEASQPALTAPHANPATNHDEWLLKTVLTNALAMKHHQQVQYLDPAAAGLPREPGLRADYGVDGVGASDERDRRSGSATPTAQTREDAGPTPRGGSPTVEANAPALLPQERRKDFKFTTIVDSSVSTGPGSPFPHPMIYEHPTLDEPARLHEPGVALFESFPRTPSLVDAAMSIASLPSASELQHQLTPSPDQHRTPFMLTNDPPSSFEASAPIDIPATRTTARNHHRRRAPSASILEAARAMPLLSPPTGPPLTGDGGGRKLHKPNSSSYDAAKARARTLMTGAEVAANHQPTDASQNHDNGSRVNNNNRLWLTRVSGDPAPTNVATGGDPQVLPTSIGSPGLPLLQSRFSDPTTAGTDSSGGRTNSTGGGDAGSESSFK